MAKPPVNAIDIPFAREVDGAFARLETDPEVRAVVLPGWTAASPPAST